MSVSKEWWGLDFASFEIGSDFTLKDFIPPYDPEDLSATYGYLVEQNRVIAQIYGVSMFRFLIACGKVQGKNFVVCEDAIIEAKDFNEAAHIAETNYPDMQISVTRIGRIHNASAGDHLPLASGS